jgi:hypothetical protein
MFLKLFNIPHDVYTEINKKIIFDDKFLNIKGYYTFENVYIEDKNKNNLSIKYIKLNILKETPTDIKIMFDKILANINNNTNTFLAFFKYDIPKTRGFAFYTGPKKNIVEEKIMSPFFHKEKDMLWNVIKNLCLNNDWDSKIRILLHGPTTNGKSSFIYRMAMCLNKTIYSMNLNALGKSDIYNTIVRRPNDIHLIDNIDITLKGLHDKELTNIEYLDNFKLDNLLEIIKNPFMAKFIVATTTNYDEIEKIFPQFIASGALKPIHFGYIDCDTLQDISEYFFGEKINGYIPDTIMIPTSEIIDLALTSLVVSKEPFINFSDNLFKLM